MQNQKQFELFLIEKRLIHKANPGFTSGKMKLNITPTSIIFQLTSNEILCFRHYLHRLMNPDDKQNKPFC